MNQQGNDVPPISKRLIVAVLKNSGTGGSTDINPQGTYPMLVDESGNGGAITDCSLSYLSFSHVWKNVPTDSSFVFTTTAGGGTSIEWTVPVPAGDYTAEGLAAHLSAAFSQIYYLTYQHGTGVAGVVSLSVRAEGRLYVDGAPGALVNPAPPAGIKTGRFSFLFTQVGNVGGFTIGVTNNFMARLLGFYRYASEASIATFPAVAGSSATQGGIYSVNDYDLRFSSTRGPIQVIVSGCTEGTSSSSDTNSSRPILATIPFSQYSYGSTVYYEPVLDNDMQPLRAVRQNLLLQFLWADGSSVDFGQNTVHVELTVLQEKLDNSFLGTKRARAAIF